MMLSGSRAGRWCRPGLCCIHATRTHFYDGDDHWNERGYSGFKVEVCGLRQTRRKTQDRQGRGNVCSAAANLINVILSLRIPSRHGGHPQFGGALWPRPAESGSRLGWLTGLRCFHSASSAATRLCRATTSGSGFVECSEPHIWKLCRQGEDHFILVVTVGE